MLLLLLFSFLFAFDRLFGVFLKRKQILKRKKKTTSFHRHKKKTKQSTMKKKCFKYLFAGEQYKKKTYQANYPFFGWFGDQP